MLFKKSIGLFDLLDKIMLRGGIIKDVVNWCRIELIGRIEGENWHGRYQKWMDFRPSVTGFERILCS